MSFGQVATRPLVSVVIPTYNRPDLICRAVASVFEQDLGKDTFEIIVVDSSPGAESVPVLKELQRVAPCPFSWYRKKSEGPGPSRQVGVQYAKGKIIAFTDSDCRVTPGWLRAGLGAFSDDIGIVQGRTEPDPDPSRRQARFSWNLVIERETFIYECCNIFYRREALQDVGEFLVHKNPNSFRPFGGEDVDLAWRAKRAGWKTRFSPDALVYHDLRPITPWRWLVMEQLLIWPSLVKRFPELRSCFFGRYFFDRGQACFVAACLATTLVGHSPLVLLAWIPYFVARTTEPSRSLKGIGRLVRSILYFPRDAISFGLLLAGSIFYRTILL